MLLLLFHRPCLGEIDDDGDTDEHANSDAEEGQRAHAIVPVALLLERDGVGFEEKVEGAVDEGHVECHEDEDGLDEEHVHRPEEVLGEDLAQVDLGLVRFGVVGPVLGLVAEFLGPSLQQHGRVRLADEDEPNDQEECRHDHRDPSRPPPAEMALRDEPAHDRPRDRPDESRGGEDGHGDSSVDGVPEVRQSAADNRERRAAEHAGEEASDENGGEVRGHREGDLKDHEDEEAAKEGEEPAVEFGHRPPE
ncbi:MAG: hypothetical protein LQ347_002493 [Umbilicaria vellea]|nr:MAG: hypothetical protein LQ347_002493 [Umbilicaria vellea]